MTARARGTGTRARLAGLAGVVAAAAAAAACSSGPKPDARAAASLADGLPADGGGAGASDGGDGGATAISSREASRKVARTLTRVSKIRGLVAKREVPAVVLERGALVASVKDKAQRELPPATIERDGLVLQLLGVAPLGFDYLGATMDLLEEQLEGFYEPKNGTMYLAGDLEGDAAKATLAHELVHALQDQTYDLRPHSQHQPGAGDRQLAAACLAEGDATSLMIDYLMVDRPDEPGQRTALDLPEAMVEGILHAGADASSKAKSVPQVLRRSLVSPYAEGIAFVHALRREGGWARVDDAWKRKPDTTEQILHPEKWAKNERPLEVPAPSAATLGAGFTKADEDTYGELGLLLLVGEWAGPRRARTLVAGWGGDRSATYTADGGEVLAHAIHVALDASEGAGKATSLVNDLRPALEKAGGPGAKVVRDAEGVCVERAELGPLVLRRRGAHVVLTAGPARRGRGGESRWKSEADCPKASAWASEILGAKTGAAASGSVSGSGGPS